MSHGDRSLFGIPSRRAVPSVTSRSDDGPPEPRRGGGLAPREGKSRPPRRHQGARERLGEIFSLVDESETGALDASQVREALTVLGDASATVEDATRAMARVGIAPDGKMEFPEFLAIVTGPEPVTPRLAAGARRSTRTSRCRRS